MADFLYFAPGRRQVKLDEARELGLGYAFDSNPAPCQVSDGPIPGRGGGVVLCRSTSRIGYFAERQTWLPMVGNPDVWVGMWTDAPPTPEELARDPMIDGEMVQLEDGRQWLVPKARLWEEDDGGLVWSHNLPTSITVDPDTAELVRGDVRPRYRKLWEMALAYDEARRRAAAGGQTEWRFNLAELAALTLQANYRIYETELVLLDVFDEQMWNRCAEIVTDSERWFEFWKKKAAALTASVESDTTNGSSGPEECDQDTGPPSPTSPPSNAECTSDAEVSCG